MTRFGKVLFIVGLSLAACKKDGGGTTTPPGGEGSGTTTAPEEKKLFDRLGGMDLIKPLVADFTTNVLANPVINARFKGVDGEKLNKLLVEQICNATGGPCEYTGRDMKTVHTGMKITEEEFNALVADLVKSLEKFKVGEQEKKELLTALGGMHDQIVGI